MILTFLLVIILCMYIYIRVADERVVEMLIKPLKNNERIVFVSVSVDLSQIKD
jgi:hypothetical protein